MLGYGIGISGEKKNQIHLFILSSSQGAKHWF